MGGRKAILGNRISTNAIGGLTIYSSTRNSILGNSILDNTEFGIYAVGPCTRTVIGGNTVEGNGSTPGDNVDLSGATGIIVQ